MALNRHARRTQQALSGTPDMVRVVNALRQGKLDMNLAAEVMTGWQMLQKLKSTDAGRRVLEQATALVLLQDSGQGTDDDNPGPGTPPVSQ
jgi:hypothetical protein